MGALNVRDAQVDASVEVANCFTALSSEHPATLEFRRAFRAGDYTARAAAIEGLAERIRTLDERVRAAANVIDLDDLESASGSTSQCQYCHRE